MKKYECWVWSDVLVGWVLSPFNILMSDQSMEVIEKHFIDLYPDRLIRIDVVEIKPIQLSLF